MSSNPVKDDANEYFSNIEKNKKKEMKNEIKTKVESPRKIFSNDESLINKSIELSKEDSDINLGFEYEDESFFPKEKISKIQQIRIFKNKSLEKMKNSILLPREPKLKDNNILNLSERKHSKMSNNEESFIFKKKGKSVLKFDIPNEEERENKKKRESIMKSMNKIRASIDENKVMRQSSLNNPLMNSTMIDNSFSKMNKRVKYNEKNNTLGVTCSSPLKNSSKNFFKLKHFSSKLPKEVDDPTEKDKIILDERKNLLEKLLENDKNKEFINLQEFFVNKPKDLNKFRGSRKRNFSEDYNSARVSQLLKTIKNNKEFDSNYFQTDTKETGIKKDPIIKPKKYFKPTRKYSTNLSLILLEFQNELIRKKIKSLNNEKGIFTYRK